MKYFIGGWNLYLIIFVWKNQTTWWNQSFFTGVDSIVSTNWMCCWRIATIQIRQQYIFYSISMSDFVEQALSGPVELYHCVPNILVLSQSHSNFSMVLSTWLTMSLYTFSRSSDWTSWNLCCTLWLTACRAVSVNKLLQKYPWQISSI